MSPIGRAFIVVNLALAGGFVFIAGNYHATQVSNKIKYDEAVVAAEKKESELNQQIGDLQERLNLSESANITLNNTATNQSSRLTELGEQIKQKEELLSQLSSSIQSLESSANAMSTQIKASTDRAGQAYEDAVAAQKAADEARSELSRAQGEIQEKERMIADLTRTSEEQQAELADKSQEIRDKDTLLAIVRVRAPGLLANGLMPPMDGTVTEASGDLVTIKVANNPSEAGAEKFRGGLVAIYDASGYKGDVSVTDASASGESLYLFGRVFTKKDGAALRAGDRATTNTN